MNISKKELLKTLIDMSPFFIDEVIHRLNPTPTEKERIQLQRRIYNLLKYYHSDNWVSKPVNEGKTGRPRTRWSYIGDKSEV